MKVISNIIKEEMNILLEKKYENLNEKKTSIKKSKIFEKVSLISSKQPSNQGITFKEEEEEKEEESENMKNKSKLKRITKLIKNSKSKMKLSLITGEEKFEEKMKSFKNLSSYLDSKEIIKKLNTLNNNYSNNRKLEIEKDSDSEESNLNIDGEDNERMNFILKLARNRLGKKKNTSEFALPVLHQNLSTYLFKKQQKENCQISEIKDEFYNKLFNKINSKDLTDKINDLKFLRKKKDKNIKEEKNSILNKIIFTNKNENEAFHDNEVSEKLLKNIYYTEFKNSANRIRNLINKASKNIYNLKAKEYEEKNKELDLNFKKIQIKNNKKIKIKTNENFKKKKKSVFFSFGNSDLNKEESMIDNIFMTEQKEPVKLTNLINNFKIVSSSSKLKKKIYNNNNDNTKKSKSLESLKKFNHLLKVIENEKFTFDSDKITISQEIKAVQNEITSMYDVFTAKN